MRVVIALGGNALLKRGEPMTAEVQRNNVEDRRPGPGIGGREAPTGALPWERAAGRVSWRLQGAAYKEVEAYPLDVLGAQTEGMIGYVLEQEMGNLLPIEVPFATILTMIEVDPADPAFEDPTKFVGPVYDKAQADALAADKGWVFKQDGDKWRRVVPSPEPKRIFEIRPIQWLIEKDVVVICAGGGGVPTMYEPERRPEARRRRGGHRQGPRQRVAGPRDRAPTSSSWPPTSTASTPTGARPISASSTGSPRQSCESFELAAGSMGPKVDGRRCDSSKRTGRARGHRSARSRSKGSWTERPEPRWCPSG